MHYVLSDIHGNTEAFDQILSMIDMKDNDHLYVLGDVVDRGPDGIALLQRIRKMANTTLLLGNHEYMMINALRHPEKTRYRSIWQRNGCEPTYDAFCTLDKDAQEDLLQYLESLPLQTEVSLKTTKDDSTFVLVHAAPKELYETDGWQNENEREFVMWYRMPLVLPEQLSEKKLIFGHTPTENVQRIDWPKMRIAYGEGVIDMDCGCAYPQYGGQLGCLRLEDMTEYYSADGVVTAEKAAAWKAEKYIGKRIDLTL